MTPVALNSMIWPKTRKNSTMATMRRLADVGKWDSTGIFYHVVFPRPASGYSKEAFPPYGLRSETLFRSPTRIAAPESGHRADEGARESARSDRARVAAPTRRRCVRDGTARPH